VRGQEAPVPTQHRDLSSNTVRRPVSRLALNIAFQFQNNTEESKVKNKTTTVQNSLTFRGNSEMKEQRIQEQTAKATTSEGL